MTVIPRPVLLMVLDGWGYSENPDQNAIQNAHTPNWDRLWATYPHTLIATSGAEVGLPAGQMGNSEVGHLNLGAGRIVYQEFTRVSRAVRTGSFRTNRTLTDAVDAAVAGGTALHVFGLLSPGGVHSHEEHLQAMVRLGVERGCGKVYLHAFLDGRDTPPRSAEPSLVAMQRLMDEIGGGRIATITGRYYAMDRDRRWERIQVAYELLAEAKSQYAAADAVAGLRAAYERGESDEFVAPTRIGEPVRVSDGDVVVFMNYRSDRARQLTRTFIDPAFDKFPRGQVPKLASFVSLTQYSPDFDIPVAFPPERPRNGFGEYISGLGLHQLRIAETEKYAHVTFFFNGGREVVFEGEDRILIPSPKVATYDLNPEMSAREVTDRLVEAIGSGRYDAIICNFANSDMVGHTGNYAAAITAIETLDLCVERVVEALLKAGGEAIITADHGNAEQMVDRETGQTHTAHTSNPVPLIYIGRKAELNAGGALCDVAPTLLTLMGLPIPREMSGKPMLRLLDQG